MDNVTHTQSLMTIRENGDANSYALLDDSGHWWLNLLHNGKAMTERQRANMRRIAATWNACDGIPTETLEAMGAGTFHRNRDRVRLMVDALELASSVFDRIAQGESFNDVCEETGCTAVVLGEIARARAVLDQPTRDTPAARDVVPGWIATIRARLSNGDPTPLAHINAAELLAEIDAR